VVQVLSQALRRLESDKAFDDRLNALGVDLNVTPAADLADRTRRESAQWERVIREANIELD